MKKLVIILAIAIILFATQEQRTEQPAAIATGVSQNAATGSLEDLPETHTEQVERITEPSCEPVPTEATVGVAVKGESIKAEKAQAIAKAMGKRVEDVFRVEKNMESLADKTILEHHRLISTILAQAEKEMLVPYNAASKATPPRTTKKTPTTSNRKPWRLSWKHWSQNL